MVLRWGCQRMGFALGGADGASAAPWPLDHLPSMAVDAPDVDTAARLAVAHHIDNRPPPRRRARPSPSSSSRPSPTSRGDPRPRPQQRRRAAPRRRRVLADRRHPPLNPDNAPHSPSQRRDPPAGGSVPVRAGAFLSWPKPRGSSMSRAPRSMSHTPREELGGPGVDQGLGVAGVRAKPRTRPAGRGRETGAARTGGWLRRLTPARRGPRASAGAGTRA